MRPAPVNRACILVVAVAGIAASIGCTMCPDPFDYSGPVPNGSSPQNDFRARSGGILPLGSTPMPWPLLVKGDPEPAAAGADEEPRPTLADEVVLADLQQTEGVVVAESEPAPVRSSRGETSGWRARR